MGFIDEIKSMGASNRVNDEKYYAEVLREMNSGVRRDGIWAKALADSDYDEKRAKARYIKLRVQSLKDEVSLAIKSSTIDKIADNSKMETEEITGPNDVNSLTAALVAFLIVSMLILAIIKLA